MLHGKNGVPGEGHRHDIVPASQDSSQWQVLDPAEIERLMQDDDESLIDTLKNDAKETIKDAANDKAEETFSDIKDSISDAWDSFTGNSKDKIDDFIDGD